MNPLLGRVRQNSPAELKAFDATCERLAGFNPDIGFEWVDGFLAALAAGPRLPEPDEWLPLMCGDAFERAFADSSLTRSRPESMPTGRAPARQNLMPLYWAGLCEAVNMAPGAPRLPEAK